MQSLTPTKLLLFTTWDIHTLDSHLFALSFSFTIDLYFFFIFLLRCFANLTHAKHMLYSWAFTLLKHELFQESRWHWDILGLLIGTLGGYWRRRKMNAQQFVVFIISLLPTSLLGETEEKWYKAQLKYSSCGGIFFITWIFPSCFCNLYILYYSSVHFPNWAQEYNAPAITCHLMIIHFAFRSILGNRPHVFFWIIKGLIKVSFLTLRHHLVGISSKKAYKLCFKGASLNSPNPTAMFCEVHAGLSTNSCMSNRCVYLVFIGLIIQKICSPILLSLESTQGYEL